VSSVKAGVGAFDQIHNLYKPGVMGRGSSEHLRGDLAGTKLYTHSALSISGFGENAANIRRQKWEAGATYIKNAIDEQCGQVGVGEQVFKKISDSTGRNINKQVLRGDLNLIKATMTEVMTSRKPERSQGEASPRFTGQVEASIDTAVAGDLQTASKFDERGIHRTFHDDANRSTYVLDGTTLAKDQGVVEGAFAKALTPEELRATTAVLHQGTVGAIIDELFKGGGFTHGLLGAPSVGSDHPTLTTHTLSRGEGGELRATIDCRMPVQSRMSSEGMELFDPAQSLLHTRMTGVITPGGNPVFRLTEPLAYDLTLVPGQG
jgi:hypothetical protein